MSKAKNTGNATVTQSSFFFFKTKENTVPQKYYTMVKSTDKATKTYSILQSCKV